MRHRLHDHIQQVLDKLQTITKTIQTTALRLWRSHLATLEHSPVYEALLLAAIDLVLGRRVDLHQLLIRLMTRLRRNPTELPDPDGWAY